MSGTPTRSNFSRSLSLFICILVFGALAVNFLKLAKLGFKRTVCVRRIALNINMIERGCSISVWNMAATGISLRQSEHKLLCKTVLFFEQRPLEHHQTSVIPPRFCVSPWKRPDHRISNMSDRVTDKAYAISCLHYIMFSFNGNATGNKARLWKTTIWLITLTSVYRHDPEHHRECRLCWTDQPLFWLL